MTEVQAARAGEHDDIPIYHTNARGDARYVRTVNDVGPDEAGNVDVEGSSGVTDHGALTGLGDDDHPQYLNNARGDVRYKPLAYVPAWTDITGKPSVFPPETHNHDALYAPLSHNHDDRYFTETESDTRYLQSVPAEYLTETEGDTRYIQEAERGDFATAGHNHDSTYVNEVDHTKAVHDALNIDADTLDGLDSTDFATATGLSNHLADATDAHDASAISFTPAGSIAATDVQAAIEEAASEGGGGGVTDHGALTGLADDDHPQYHNDARGDARYSLLAHTHDHIVPLAEDTNAEADPITDYLEGLSIMPVSDTADWNSLGIDGTVVTSRTGTRGAQWFHSEYVLPYYRSDGGTGWNLWVQLADASHVHSSLPMLSTDQYAESTAITSIVSGMSVMPVTAGANWGPNIGEAGRVVTERSSSTGTQQFYTDNGKMFFRAYSGSWGSWQPVIVDGDARLTNARTPTAHASTHTNGTDDIQNATASQKGLATAAQITKLDGIETAATADQTAAEILTAIKTVDGAASGLDADLLDGNQGSAFVLGTDYEDADVLTKVKNVDGTGSGLDADTVDGSHASAFASATGLSDHLADTTDAHDASAISILDTAAQYTATDVEAALAEVLDGLQAHEAGITDAHDASAVSFVPTGTIAATNVQSAIAEAASEAGGGGGGTSEVEIDFGAFPGATDTTVAVTGQTGILSGSIVEAWVKPKATTEHTADEHWVESLKVLAGNIVAGTGFTIYGRSEDNVRLYGRFNIAWRWA